MTRKHFIVLTLLLCLVIMGVIYAFNPPKKRYAVLAGYNANGVIKPYVIDYLKGLNEVADGVVYITDSPLNEGEEQKIAHLIMHGLYVRHEEYDWGSYKRGFNWLKQNGYLDNAYEVIFANDSTFAPLKSFKPMFEAMDKRPELDFWGNTVNPQFWSHVQSYFFVIREPVIKSRAFQYFMNNIKHQDEYSFYIIEYELKLTPHLAQYGYKYGSYHEHFPSKLPPKPDKTVHKEDQNSYPLSMIRVYNNQFLKRRTFTTLLEILEDRAQLLSYLKRTYPKTYEQIITEFPHTLTQYPHK